MNKEELTTLSDFAKKLKMDKSNLRKYVLSKGIEFLKIRTKESRGQITLALTKEDMETIESLREQEGFVVSENSGSIINGNNGYLYIIQTAPDLSKERVKMGFTTSIEARLQAYKTASPTARLVKAWPCKKTWEQAAIDCITQKYCNLVGSEVYDILDLDKVLTTGDKFFEAMPNL